MRTTLLFVEHDTDVRMAKVSYDGALHVPRVGEGWSALGNVYRVLSVITEYKDAETFHRVGVRR